MKPVPIKPTIPACHADACAQGRKKCPCPTACETPSPDTAPRAIELFAAVSGWLVALLAGVIVALAWVSY